jgi:hypothetical protein
MTNQQIEHHLIDSQPLATLIARCQAAQALGRSGEPPTTGEDGACFELLRRGLEADDAAAWRAFEAQFQPLFYQWIHQELAHFGLYQGSSDEVEELWAEARSRFVNRYSRLQLLSDNFDHIGAVLKVIQKCIRSAVQELRRQHERHERLVSAIQQIQLQEERAFQLPSTQVELAELRRCITHQIEQDLPEEPLRQLLFLRYVDNLKPREISALDPEHYPDTAAVHQALERIMKRLRRRVDQYITRCL